jgi:hypothetical protein
MKNFADVNITLNVQFAPLASDVLQLLDVAANIYDALPEGLQRKKLERKIRRLIRRFERHVYAETEEDEDEDQGNDHRPSSNGDVAGHSDDE